MREERELLRRKLQKSKQYEAMMVTEDFEPMAAGFFFHFLPPRSPPAPVSLWSDSDSQSEQSSMERKNSPVLMSLLPLRHLIQKFLPSNSRVVRILMMLTPLCICKLS
ncbi:hypothetical protein SLA2020_242360 [Shorea laevis]